jgi:hypothetical protein
MKPKAEIESTAGRYFIETELNMKLEDIDIMNIDLKNATKEDVIKYSKKCFDIWFALFRFYGHERNLITRKWGAKSRLAHAEVMKRNCQELGIR